MFKYTQILYFIILRAVGSAHKETEASLIYCPVSYYVRAVTQWKQIKSQASIRGFTVNKKNKKIKCYKGREHKPEGDECWSAFSQ